MVLLKITNVIQKKIAMNVEVVDGVRNVKVVVMLIVMYVMVLGNAGIVKGQVKRDAMNAEAMADAGIVVVPVKYCAEIVMEKVKYGMEIAILNVKGVAEPDSLHVKNVLQLV